VADRSTGSDGSAGGQGDDDSAGGSDFKRFAAATGAALSILIGVQALTGWNPLKNLVSPTTSTPPSPPDFAAETQDWAGPCDPGCPVHATFRNFGGQGGAIARFDVTSSASQTLASCSAVLPPTARGGVTEASCTAYSSALANYRGPLYLRVLATP
jgi:hypothetical protein